MGTKKMRLDPFREREARKYVNPIPSREFIMQYLEEIGKPVTASHIIEAFGIDKEDEQEAMRRRLKAMLHDGQLIKNRRGYFALVCQMDLVRGRVVGHKEGYGFVVPEDGSDDIFLTAWQIRALFPGDLVLVSTISPTKGRGKREGVVVEILERNFTQIVGRYFEEQGMGFVVPANKTITREIIIPKGQEAGAAIGQFVVAEITVYPTLRCGASGKVIEVIGDHMAPGMEIEVAIRSYELPYKWPDEVLAECERIPREITKKDRSARVSLQDLPFVTIDGEDAKDFDDAVFCERAARGGWKLYVAIADVSHYVRYDTALDLEAYARGNSVYFPNHVIPMLPESLSNDLCSLKPKQERLVFACEMHISKSGKISSYKFYDAIISSKARLTYDEVYALLEGKSKSKSLLLPHLQELNNLYNALMKARQLRGAIEFSSIETKIDFGLNRKIERIVPVARHYVYNMIEECMLAANVCASGILVSGKIPALYRVHEGPDPEKLATLRGFLSKLGLSLTGGSKPKSVDYAKLIREIKDRPDEHLVQTVLLRSLRQALYTPENTGHFGLAYSAYAHFTSPIRRYADLLNHRAIRYLLHGGKSQHYAYTLNMMQNFGEHCSMAERRADDATRDAINWLKCEFMQDKVGKVFEGIISNVTSFGAFVELKDIFVEGLLHVTALKSDYYTFEPTKYLLKGKRTGKKYSLGDKIKVLVSRVDLDEREIDFDLA
ncbi:MAG: ribonuclease R [Gammaproteobacteria bacterium]|nr:ribonuclease R [Gammaproteobacteria bacterium]